MHQDMLVNLYVVTQPNTTSKERVVAIIKCCGLTVPHDRIAYEIRARPALHIKAVARLGTHNKLRSGGNSDPS